MKQEELATASENVEQTIVHYWQHRISHNWDVSKQLFDLGYLTIGWQGLTDSDILISTAEKGELGFNESAAKAGLITRNRWCLYRFFCMKPGDVVIVPLYERDFAIVEITGFAEKINTLPVQSFSSVSGQKIVNENGLKYYDSSEIIDLGYYVSFNLLSEKIIPRGFASSRLQSRMKHQFINVDVTDLAKDIRNAAIADAPADLHDIIVDATAESVLNSINANVTPDGFEHLVEWYMKKAGASRVYIPAKNESGKENGADADVIAEFDALGLVFYIQAKKHEGYTDEWAIHQISNYKVQKENSADDFTYIPWVITTAKFQDTVCEFAHSVGVRLIDGLAFSKMLIEKGVESINDVMQYLK